MALRCGWAEWFGGAQFGEPLNAFIHVGRVETHRSIVLTHSGINVEAAETGGGGVHHNNSEFDLSASYRRRIARGLFRLSRSSNDNLARHDSIFGRFASISSAMDRSALFMSSN